MRPRGAMAPCFASASAIRAAQRRADEQRLRNRRFTSDSINKGVRVWRVLRGPGGYSEPNVLDPYTSRSAYGNAPWMFSDGEPNDL